MERAENSASQVRVFVRARPLLVREALNGRYVSLVEVSPDRTLLNLCEFAHIDVVEPAQLDAFVRDPRNQTLHQFRFTRAFDEAAGQEEVFRCCAEEIVRGVAAGASGSVIAYGQTGSGKTHTMVGGAEPAQQGVLFRAARTLFDCLAGAAPVRFSCYQVYNEQLFDMLGDRRRMLSLREDAGGCYIERLSEWPVASPEEVMRLVQRAMGARFTSGTDSNDNSSRSHAVFTLATPAARLDLVDLAGSERLSRGRPGARQFLESRTINKSLSVLSKVILSLSRGRASHVPYRDSKLTRALSHTLGGGCRTALVACISPAVAAFAESLSTLKFACKAKTVSTVSDRKRPRASELTISYSSDESSLRERLGALEEAHNAKLAEAARNFQAELDRLRQREAQLGEQLLIERNRADSLALLNQQMRPPAHAASRELDNLQALLAEQNATLRRMCEAMRLKELEVSRLQAQLKACSKANPGLEQDDLIFEVKGVIDKIVGGLRSKADVAQIAAQLLQVQSRFAEACHKPESRTSEFRFSSPGRPEIKSQTFLSTSAKKP